MLRSLPPPLPRLPYDSKCGPDFIKNLLAYNTLGVVILTVPNLERAYHKGVLVEKTWIQKESSKITVRPFTSEIDKVGCVIQTHSD